jgi:hypothetical protein
MYTILKQFIPGNNQIWAQQLSSEDNIFQYETEEEAQVKLDELNFNDTEGRGYKIQLQ